MFVLFQPPRRETAGKGDKEKRRDSPRELLPEAEPRKLVETPFLEDWLGNNASKRPRIQVFLSPEFQCVGLGRLTLRVEHLFQRLDFSNHLGMVGALHFPPDCECLPLGFCLA
jgi:hypothetical protein